MTAKNVPKIEGIFWQLANLCNKNLFYDGSNAHF